MNSTIRSGDESILAHTLSVLSQFLENMQEKKAKPSMSDWYRAETDCPQCKTGTVKFMYGGPRAMRMVCSTPKCICVMS